MDIDKTINRILRGVLRITRLPHYQYVLTAFVAALLEKKILRRGERSSFTCRRLVRPVLPEACGSSRSRFCGSTGTANSCSKSTEPA